MNTYSENLQNAISNTLNALAAQQAILVSAETSAEYALYYAQSAELTAVEKLNGTNANVTYSQNVNNQSIINKNQSLNLLASMTEANADVTTSNSNMATAAANLQIASNAITALASDIGAALNVATASMYDTQTYKKIVEANSFINEVANDAKALSLQAMDASGKTSEIIATVALTQATSVDGLIGNLLAATQAELDKYTSLSVAENATVAASKLAERQAEGVADDALTQVVAIDDTYQKANQEMNLALTVTASSLDTINVSFNALLNPLPTFYALPASGIVIPDAKPRYFLAIVEQSQSVGFSMDRAEQLFAQKNAIDGPYFYPVVPAGVDRPQQVLLDKDVYGDDIQGGRTYVAFIYIELSMDYKRYLADFNDQLSAASAPFIPAALLPQANGISDGGKSDGHYSSVVFNAEPHQAPIFKSSLDALARVKLAVQALQATSRQLPAGLPLRVSLDQLIGSAAQVEKVAAKLTFAIEHALKHKDLLRCKLDDEQGNRFQQVLLKLEKDIGEDLSALLPLIEAVKSAGIQARQEGDPDAPLQARALDEALAVFDAATSCTNAVAHYNRYQLSYDKQEFRCIVVQVDDLAQLNLKSNTTYPALPIYFNLSIAEQVPESNLEIASPALVVPATEAKTGTNSTGAEPAVAVTTSAAEATAAADTDGQPATTAHADTAGVAGDQDGQLNRLPAYQYVATFDDTSTDNFGNKIEAGVKYQAFVLTIVPGDDDYLSVMAAAPAPLILYAD